ncbi:ATP F0F1 synthase synthase [Acinetobacter towneri]|uniref:ATP F0F1 synthase synthase n=1 Tax=Acinetobacter towneri TaxID=202956 RepID=A0AB35M294_9GAMM|nr:ATP F0F1 synthase synthase [Acinetobacter towneri]MDM1718905.1 ATP F0F1 synthase synthase [Acinetobacter towneri]MDM1731069.1 ATP F0F1 synthase synthase [Acinetobacter towneri]MDM1733781.1 ATP F0F1 synthase synthase [Acinetobacter towneri]MDM1739020.1 ATP F0F1 synthase synthase [Acinetobacter towneri]MDM1741724.1 ATP F0F1 synthase synthase [Acinetobacter towneri]
MNQLVARVRGRKKPFFYKLLSDKKIYEFDVSKVSLVEYSSEHLLDEDSWFKIDNFSQQPFFLNFLGKQFVSSEYNSISKSKYKDIAYLCSVQDGEYFFQKVTPSSYVTKTFLALGDELVIENNVDRIVINNSPDAIYFKKEDRLIFRNLATISSIFNGIDILYKEATQEEVQKFLDFNFIKLSDGYDIQKIGKNNRKRIALALSTFEKMSDDDKDAIFDYIQDYCTELKFEKSTKNFEISSETEMKFLLYGIEQRFYTTVYGKEKRLANSVQRL